MLVQKDAPIRFRIHKANAGEGDYDLSGATFSVTPVDAEGEPLITEATDAAGDVDLSNLALAVDTDYTIAETKAPDGFMLDADAVTVHIDADGTVALSGEAPASYTLDAADDGAFVLTCSDEPYVLQLLKTDPEGSMLPDASFDVTGQFAGGVLRARASRRMRRGRQSSPRCSFRGRRTRSQRPPRRRAISRLQAPRSSRWARTASSRCSMMPAGT